ncbi:glutamate racemase [Oceanotoga teriensis]|uniref:Glutamate racemase n=2 Tax=Petrotogaceae TaxID=1643949 RepID=A0AA45C4V2_9BACT|nr:glutamate racemase [Oceanotoga teriensis]PWJ87288.1 glutamate racemase [Oceanotoga teriensis]
MRIGFFDSGIGGLTVLKKVVKFFNNHNYFYFGDTLNVPYGSKPENFLIENLEKTFDFFEDLKIDLVISACNTSDSMVKKGLVKLNNRSFDYISIIDSGIKQVKNGEKILLLATENTIKSGSYREGCIKNGVKKIKEVPCPLFVPLIEEGYWYGAMSDSITRYYLQDSENKYDKVILGCTHYPILKNHINKVLNTDIIDPADGVINSLIVDKKIPYIKGKAHIEFFITGNVEKFRILSRRFMKNIRYSANYSKIDTKK